MYMKIIDKLKNKNIAILGYGKEGKSTYKFLRKYIDTKLTIIDRNENLYEQNEELKKDINIDIVVGENYLDNLDIYDIIIKSPGVKIPHDTNENIINKIYSQMELALEIYKERVIGVTGTKGKSTTSSLLYKVLKDQDVDCYLLGNVGNPIFDYIEDISDESLLIIEMSSYQLEMVNYSPHIGIILNLYEEHLNYHETKDDYFLSKLNMFKYQKESDYCLYTSDNKNVKTYLNDTYISNKLDIKKEFVINGDEILFNDKIVYKKSNKRLLKGNHNLTNILFILRIVLLLGYDIDKAVESISTFKPLEHRMEYVGVYNGITYYNDVIATIPEATINCLNSLPGVDTLILGGLDRGINYELLIDYLKTSEVKNFICMPESGYKIADALENKNTYKVETLEEAVKIAKEVTKNICVLSPAASSYNQFKNFEEKGKLYKELIKE